MRICLASQFGEGNWIGWLLQEEGHDTSIVVKEGRYAEALNGLVPMMSGESPYEPEKYDCIVFDATGQGKGHRCQ